MNNYVFKFLLFLFIFYDFGIRNMVARYWTEVPSTKPCGMILVSFSFLLLCGSRSYTETERKMKKNVRKKSHFLRGYYCSIGSKKNTSAQKSTLPQSNFLASQVFLVGLIISYFSIVAMDLEILSKWLFFLPCHHILKKSMLVGQDTT